MIIYFKDSGSMEAAYGFSITVTMLMTTLLMCYFLLYRLNWNIIYVILFALVFGTIEFSFFIANVAKIKERWMFLFFDLCIFMTMYIWYYAKKINNRYIKIEQLGKHSDQLKELSEDDSIPKFATHLIYLTKAGGRHEVEEKIIKSIFSKIPKRADVYWFVHLNKTKEPYTLNYDVTELQHDKVIKININVGFKIQPKTELYFKKIVIDLVENKKLKLQIRPDGSSKYNEEPDFKFVIIKKYLSVKNEFALREGLLLHAYFKLKHLRISDEKAFGLDKSDVVIEFTPTIYQHNKNIELIRV
jgi:KUP system potassium uptake protein